MQKAASNQVCPVVGTSASVLPPDHPSTTSGEVCPVTNAKVADHKGVVAGTSEETGAISTQATTTQCPVTGSKVTHLPPDHPSTMNGDTCPVTKATLSHHEGVVKEHPPVPANASAKDCPVLQMAETSQVCPVVGTSAKVLPPNHPTSEAGTTCPVTGAKAEHHDNLSEHPSVQQADGSAKCPVTGAVAQHHQAIEPSAANQAMAQCPVTGQFADGSRPAVELPAAVVAEPIKFTIMGIPFSTFTRTVTMGLHELNIPFTQIPVPPHSKEVLEFNPFGRLPVLLVEHSGKKVPMFESDSIIRYLDSADDRILRFSEKDMINNQKLEEWIGIISNYVFEAVEVGVVKPYLSDDEKDVKSAVSHMHEVLSIVENRMHGPFIMGIRSTWADLYLYPILADLAATPYVKELDKYTKLQAWTTRMQKRSTAQATKEGTLEGGAKPPA